MTPDQLNAAAAALTPPTGGMASLESGDDDRDDSSEDEEGGGATGKPGHMTVSSSDEGSDDRSHHELTRAEALAALRRSKGKNIEEMNSNKSANTTIDKEKGVCVCLGARVSVRETLITVILHFNLSHHCVYKSSARCIHRYMKNHCNSCRIC